MARLGRDTAGATAIFVAIGLIPLIGSIGLAVDASLGYMLKSRITKSLDTAGLAAGRVALDDDAAEVARMYFDANFGANPSVTITDFSFDLDDTRQFVTLTANATAPTFFMRIFGQDSVNVAARTVIQRATTGMELALVLDNTGSMNGAPFNAMQQAAYDLIDIIYGNDTEIDNLWVSLVPFTATVNIGSGRTGWLKSGDRVLTNIASYSTAGWKGCVMAQASPHDADDTPLSSLKLDSYFYASTTRTEDNKWPTIKPDRTYGGDVNAPRGPNLGCGPAITPLTSSRATIDTAIGNMGAWGRGGTTGNLGLSWGWRTLSPRWRGVWGGATPAALPLDYDTDLMEKVVVILTDGNNQFHDQDTASGTPASDFTAYGRIEAMGVTGSDSQKRAAGRVILDNRMAGTCAAMKAQGEKGITIYTIIFGGTPDAAAQTLFRNCATLPGMYYYAPNNATLAAAFKAIGGQLASLRIIE